MPFIQLKQQAARELFPGFKGKFIHTESMTFAYWDIQAGSILPEHSHPQEQIAHILAGTFELIVGGERKILEPGIVAVIPSNAVHSGKAITDCRIVDLFHPVRDDYR